MREIATDRRRFIPPLQQHNTSGTYVHQHADKEAAGHARITDAAASTARPKPYPLILNPKRANPKP